MNVLRVLLSRKFRISYSQLGEDITIAGLLPQNKSLTYVDIGANHPMYGNNSFYFYLRGGRGVCIDPNRKFQAGFKKFRSRDQFICTAVSDSHQAECFLYEDASDTDSFVETADPGQARPVQKIANLHINAALKLADTPNIDLLSLDTETMDARLIQAIDYKQFNIRIICIETNKSESDTKVIHDVLTKEGYEFMAKNPINSIYRKATPAS